MNICTLAFAGSDITLGLSIITELVMDLFPDANVEKADQYGNNVKQADYVLVSLYWWRDVYEYLRYLAKNGIDPRRERPIFIIGGMAALNPRVLDGYFHYAVIGDGEPVIGELINRLERGESLDGLDGLWRDGDCTIGIQPTLPAKNYIDVRTNKTTRIEISRGCKQMCQFCELAHIKPYRELPGEAIRHLINSSKTKTIALFAADMWSHSNAKEIEEYCRRAGKNNSASDVRLDMIKKVNRCSRVRFGLEGFSETTRKRFGKIISNDRFISLMAHVYDNLKTSTGKPIRSVTCYVIGDLPGEGRDSIIELWDTLKRFDEFISEKFTFFLSTSSFAPSQFTPMEREGIDPWSEWNSWMSETRPFYKNLVIATRGAVISPPQRLAQMITIRGDERCSKVVMWMATKAYKLLKSQSHKDTKYIKAALEKSGYPFEMLFERLDDGVVLPWSNIQYPEVKRRIWS
jgi:radical SAM superfamily enzyme YgiQ (UPF0313 family)